MAFSTFMIVNREVGIDMLEINSDIDLCLYGCGRASYLSRGMFDRKTADKQTHRHIVRRETTSQSSEGQTRKKPVDVVGALDNKPEVPPPHVDWEGASRVVLFLVQLQTKPHMFSNRTLLVDLVLTKIKYTFIFRLM